MGMMRATRSTMGMINTIKTTSFGILREINCTSLELSLVDNKYPRHIIETLSQHILVSSLLQTRGISNTTLFTILWLSTSHSSYHSTRGSSHTIKESISFDKRFSSTLLYHVRHNSHSFTTPLSHIRLNSHSFTTPLSHTAQLPLIHIPLSLTTQLPLITIQLANTPTEILPTHIRIVISKRIWVAEWY